MYHLINVNANYSTPRGLNMDTYKNSKICISWLYEKRL